MSPKWWRTRDPAPTTDAPPAAPEMTSPAELAAPADLGARTDPAGLVNDVDLVEAVRGALAGVAHSRWEAVERLTLALLAVAGEGDAGAGREALAAVAGAPRAVIRLDEYVRRLNGLGEHAWWIDRRVAGARRVPLAEAVRWLAADRPEPLNVALLSMYRDGRIRERALIALLAVPELMPFLVLRCVDWARPLRDRARAGLATILADRPRYVTAVLPTALRAANRYRGRFAVTQATAALLTAPPTTWRELITPPGTQGPGGQGPGGQGPGGQGHGGLGDVRQRRLVVELAIGRGVLGRDELVAAAEGDPDPVIRLRAAGTACRDAVWERRFETLRRLATCRHAAVRALALTGLTRLGRDDEVAARLDDGAPLVRALARDALRRTGADPLSRYRELVTGSPTSEGGSGMVGGSPTPTPTPGAVAGLAEAGSGADAGLVRPLLAHPEARVRAAAVRACRLLDAVPVEVVVPLLRDPSAGVVREACTALLPYTRVLPSDLAEGLLGEARVELRRAGYRLLRHADPATRLLAARRLTDDPDPKLARRAQADVTTLNRAVG